MRIGESQAVNSYIAGFRLAADVDQGKYDMMPPILLCLPWLVADPDLLSTLSSPVCVSLIKQHTVKGIPKYSNNGHDYENGRCVFGKENALVCIRPLHPAAQAGEFLRCSPRTGKVSQIQIPQPKGFPPFHESRSCFEDTGIWMNHEGDCFLRWSLGGNGRHAVGLFSKKTNSFVVQKSNLHLYHNSRAVPSTDGSWYFLCWNGSISVYKPDDKLNLLRLGSHDGLGHHIYGVLDASFRSNELLHVVYAEVDSNNHARMRAIDFNVRHKRWSTQRTLAHINYFVSSVHPKVMMLNEKSPHYFWSVNDGQQQSTDSGIYYLAAGKTDQIRLSASTDGYQLLAHGRKIVLLYTLKDEPNKVCFRVIQSGIAGPEASLTISDNRKHNLGGDCLLLGSAGEDLLWFVNTQDINTFYELRIIPVVSSRKAE